MGLLDIPLLLTMKLILLLHTMQLIIHHPIMDLRHLTMDTLLLIMEGSITTLHLLIMGPHITDILPRPTMDLDIPHTKK